MKTLAGSIFVIIVTLQAQQPPRPPVIAEFFDNRSVDIIRIAPGFCTLEIDNERLRVIRIKVPEATRVPIHGHRAGVIVAITGLHVKLTSPEGTAIDIRLPAGDLRWIDAGIHAEENLGGAAEYLFIESKG